ncbi:molybdenum cofactor guanylyltransferase [Chloroflexus sp.]|uniref:molybdenum cofactor guanylyltransferase n=1 Tax=Chloroflexus sp. TaxID=1904827 RepID=UPI00262C14D8|nr:molybdenum cofactor guanylyltransferase [uncultured Chloroflexus sp.]
MTEQTFLSGIVIAGGRSRRFGTDKRRLRLWGDCGPRLLDHAVALLQPLCVETIVVLNDAEAWPDIPARLVCDEQPGSGAIGGLISGLQAMRAPAALVIAADMPLIAPQLLAALAQWPFTGDALAPTLPGQPDRPQPLLAVYRQSALPPLRRVFDRGERRLQTALRSLSWVDPGPELWQRYDPLARSLMNLNTPDDLAMVQAWLKSNSPC